MNPYRLKLSAGPETLEIVWKITKVKNALTEGRVKDDDRALTHH